MQAGVLTADHPKPMAPEPLFPGSRQLGSQGLMELVVLPSLGTDPGQPGHLGADGDTIPIPSSQFLAT